MLLETVPSFDGVALILGLSVSQSAGIILMRLLHYFSQSPMVAGSQRLDIETSHSNSQRTGKAPKLIFVSVCTLFPIDLSFAVLQSNSANSIWLILLQDGGQCPPPSILLRQLESGELADWTMQTRSQHSAR